GAAPPPTPDRGRRAPPVVAGPLRGVPTRCAGAVPGHVPTGGRGPAGLDPTRPRGRPPGRTGAGEGSGPLPARRRRRPGARRRREEPRRGEPRQDVPPDGPGTADGAPDAPGRAAAAPEDGPATETDDEDPQGRGEE